MPTPVTSEVYSGMSKLTRTWLCAPEVINFVRLQFVKQLHQIHRVGQITVMQEQTDPVDVRVGVEMIDARSVKRARAADDAVDFVALFEQQIGQIAAVLAGDARDERFFHVVISSGVVSFRAKSRNLAVSRFARHHNHWGKRCLDYARHDRSSVAQLTDSTINVPGRHVARRSKRRCPSGQAPAIQSIARD